MPACPAERLQILLASARHAVNVITAPPQTQSDSPKFLEETSRSYLV